MPGRRLVALCVVSLAALAPVATAATGIHARAALWQRLFRALVVPQVTSASSAALAVDLSDGNVVFAQNDALALAPASNEKLAVTYAALVALGPGFRIRTDVLGNGERDGAVWHGDLVLEGSGDPTLSSDDLAELAAQVRVAGIRRVTGRIVGDEAFFDARRTAPGWKPWYYVNESPPLSALTVDRGVFRGRTAPEPALASARLFRRALRSAGVAAPGPAVTGTAELLSEPIASIASEPLRKIVRAMDRDSDNFTAELLLKQVGAAAGAGGTTAAGAAAVTRLLAEAGVPLDGVRIVDGSGLSVLDRLTARAIVGILRAAWADPALRPAFLGALPVAGVSGTLEHRLERGPARGHVRAKTGTTDLASALSGFADDRYAFAVLQNGHPVATWWARLAQDRFVTVLAGG